MQATNGLVAHGANAADLQPFQQTPEADGHVRSVQSCMQRTCQKTIPTAYVFVHLAADWLYWWENTSVKKKKEKKETSLMSHGNCRVKPVAQELLRTVSKWLS